MMRVVFLIAVLATMGGATLSYQQSSVNPAVSFRVSESSRADASVVLLIRVADASGLRFDHAAWIASQDMPVWARVPTLGPVQQLVRLGESDVLFRIFPDGEVLADLLNADQPPVEFSKIKQPIVLRYVPFDTDHDDVTTFRQTSLLSHFLMPPNVVTPAASSLALPAGGYVRLWLSHSVLVLEAQRFLWADDQAPFSDLNFTLVPVSTRGQTGRMPIRLNGDRFYAATVTLEMVHPNGRHDLYPTATLRITTPVPFAASDYEDRWESPVAIVWD